MNTSIRAAFSKLRDSVQAKGGKDRMSVVQIEQDVAVCAAKFKDAICRPLGAQFMQPDLIALFEFEMTPDGVRVRTERHYYLVPPDELTEEELRLYRIPALSQFQT